MLVSALQDRTSPPSAYTKHGDELDKITAHLSAWPMPIYGTALLAACHLLGIILGDLLGRALGMTTNVGGVGIAMILLIVARYYLHQAGRLNPDSEKGVIYWGAIYIPVVVAMAMQQNMLAALRGGPMALIAALATVVVCGCFVALINRREPVPNPVTTDSESR